MSLPKGQYMAKVVEQYASQGDALVAKFGKSMTKGTPQVTVLCEVVSGPRIGEQMDWTGYFSGGATDGTLRTLRAFGFEGDDLDAFNDQKPSKEFQITVDDEEYKGKVRQKIVRVGADTTFTPAEMTALSRQLKPKLAQFKIEDSPMGDDDTPF